MTSEQDRLRDLPYSHRLVLHVINEADRPLTRREIHRRSSEFVIGGVEERTIRRAVHKLRSLGAVEQHNSPPPEVKPRYSVAGQTDQASDN